MDFEQQLVKKITNENELSLPLELGYLDSGESLVMYPIAGSSVEAIYMDGITDQSLNYEIAMKSKNQKRIHYVLWELQDYIRGLKTLESEDGSFEFNGIEITNTPFINQIDEQGWFVFLLDIKADITAFEK